MKETSQQLVQDRIEELRESTDFVSTLLESPIGYAIMAADFDGNVIAFNEGARRIYGYAPEEVIGKKDIEIFFPEDSTKGGELQELIDDLLEKESLSYEGEKVRKNGEIFPAQILFTLRKDKSGKVVGFIEIVEDLTERKKLEADLNERYKELQCLYGIARIAERPGITLNELYQEVVNILPSSWQYPEFACARITIDNNMFQTANCGDTDWKQSADIMTHGVKAGMVEVSYLEEKPATDEGPFLKEERALIDAVAERLERITERMQAEEAQERLSQQLQAKVSELETFSFGIAHDLRSPLVSIEGFSRLLRTDIQNQKMERVQEDIRLLESGVRKMQQFLNRTLEYSRAGYQVKPTMNVPFGRIVKEVITEFNGQMSSIGATVSLADTFPTVYADRMRMVQVLTNLIQNSINYRDKTRPLTIEIGHRRSGSEVVFFVRDNGTGIDESETEKVFALFYRGTADGEGSGAGLAIVKRIIEAHGGRIWVQQGQSGKGTTMCFTLSQQSGTNNGGDNNGKD